MQWRLKGSLSSVQPSPQDCTCQGYQYPPYDIVLRVVRTHDTWACVVRKALHEPLCRSNVWAPQVYRLAIQDRLIAASVRSFDRVQFTGNP